MSPEPDSAPPRLEQLLDAATDGVLALDPRGRPTWLNASAERILGLSRGELLGHVLWEGASALEGSELAQACRHAAEEGVPATVEEHLAHLGTWIEARVFPSREGLLVMLRDVTPLKQLEADADRLHALVRSAPVAAFITRGPQHVFELNNPRHRELHGRRELLGLPAREPLLELEGQGVLALLDRAYASGEALVLDAVPLRVPTPDGGREERLFHLTCEPLRDAAGQVEGLAVFTFEVTEQVRARRKAEQLAEDLRRNEERFRSLVVGTSTILWVTDPSGHTQADSPSWCAFTGQSNAKWRDGSGWLEAIHPEDRALASAAWKRAFETRGLYEVEYRLRRADGTYLPVVSRGVPVLEADGTVREWVGSITDISPQRRARQALELLSEASVALSSSLDLRQALERLARCVVPRFAEWCAVYVRDPAGAIERVACVDHHPTRALRLRMEGVLLEDSPHDPRRVLAHGEVEHFPPLSEQLLFGQELNLDRRALRFAFAGLRGMTVPLILEGQVLGAITFAAGRGYSDYDGEDQRVAGELAHRAAVAVEHARLFELARAGSGGPSR
jgi:PAS domain S-box-containing protein